MTERRIINIPFQGFYHSFLDMEIDIQIEVQAEAVAQEYGFDLYDAVNAVYWHADFAKCRWQIAKKYVEAFNAMLESDADIDLELKFHALVSPREYNFETDKIDCTIPLHAVDRLWAATPVVNLEKMIKARHSSRSGFISFYSNDLAVWAGKSRHEWDHNELGTLLLAFMSEHEGIDPDWEAKLTEEMTEEVSLAALDCIDFDEMITELAKDERDAGMISAITGLGENGGKSEET